MVVSHSRNSNHNDHLLVIVSLSRENDILFCPAIGQGSFFKKIQIPTGCPKKMPSSCWNQLNLEGIFLGHPVENIYSYRSG